MILLINNILNSFYKCTLIVLQTINTNIYLKFRIFDAIFNYLEYLKKTIKIKINFSTKIVTRVCNKTSIKFAEYYSKIKKNW